MNCWEFLKIEPTKEEREIKRAYSKLLPKYHPEKDHDGFMRLRQAYEEAVAYANAKEEENTVEKTPVDIWIDRVDEVYQSYKRRIDVEEWKRLLEEDVCMAIDSSVECNERLLIYLSDHIMVPHEVLEVLENFFHWEAKKDQLCELFPQNYIEYLCANAKYPDAFQYMKLDPDMDINYESFFETYYQLDRMLNNREDNPEGIANCLSELENFGVVHPDVLAIRIRTHVMLEEKEVALQLCEELQKLEPGTIFTLQILARCHLEIDEYDQAIAYYEQILEQEEKSVNAYLGCSACYKEKGDFVKAMELAKKAQDIVPYDGYVRNYIVVLNEEMVENKRQAYEEHPEDDMACYEYCRVLADAYRFEEATELLGKVNPECVSRVEYLELCSKAYMDMENRNTDRAIEYLEELVTIDPDKLAYLEDLGYCYGEANRLEEAKEIYEKAKEIDVTSPRIYYRLAQIYIKEKDYQRAVDVCDEGLSYHDQIPNLYHFKAEAYYHMKQYAEAFQLCDRALSILPYIDTYEIKAKILNEVEEFEEVEELLKDMVNSEFISDMLIAQLAKAKRRMGKTQEAWELLNTAMENGSNEAEIYYQMGVYAFGDTNMPEEDRYNACLSYADMALERMKEFEYSYVMLKCHTLNRLHRLKDALEVYLEYEEKGFLNEQMAMSIGDMYMEFNDAKNALNYYTKAFVMNERSYQVHGRLADAYIELKEFEKALEEVNLQIEIEPSDYYYVDRGIIYSQMDDVPKAIENYKLAIADNEENCYAWSNMAYLLRDAGEHEAALEAYMNAHRFGHPNSINAYEAARLLKRLSRKPEAIELLKEVNATEGKRYNTVLLYADLLSEVDLKEACGQYAQLLKQVGEDDRLEVLTHWADAYKHYGKYDMMLDVWERAATKEELKSYDYYKYLGLYYEDYKNDYKKALKYFQKAYALWPESDMVNAHIGDLYFKLKKEEKAQSYYQCSMEAGRRGLKNNPKSPCSHDWIGMNYSYLDQYDQAIEHFAFALYYGPTGRNCSLCECYEAYFDLAEMFVRMALKYKKYAKKKTQIAFFETYKAWASDIRRTFTGAQEKLKEIYGYVPSQDVIEKVLTLLADYEKALDPKSCLQLAYAYYEKAHLLRPEKHKYKTNMERIAELLKK